VNFDESVKYLFSLGNEVLAMKLGLGNIRKVLNALDNPQNNYCKVQVAGTNGKGSTCAFIEGICRSSKIKVGLFTSPHLVSITERVRINGRDIREEDFARYATKIRETSEKLVVDGELESVPTYFEQVTAIALHAFAEARVELAILETGLGGRFDAVTAAGAEIAVITPIDFDHQDILGNTLTAIAAEKAAIIRPDSTVITAHQKPEAAAVIDKVCRELHITPISKIEWEITGKDRPGRELIEFRAGSIYRRVWLGLRGRHQIENAATAILATEALAKKFTMSVGNAIEGLGRAVHRGRMEFKRKNILFDGAHNVAGAKALAAFIDEYVEGEVTMIFGAMRDKDLSEMAATLFPKAERLILTRPENTRSSEPGDIRKFAIGKLLDENIFETETVKEALELAREIRSPDGIICVTGSLYLVGEAQKLLNNNAYE
jgi:dihydrofolate synthase / folylpolyglutamate synthase